MTHRLTANLRPIDRRNAVQLLTAWTCDDPEALKQTLDQVDADPLGTNGLVFGLLEYARWLTQATGPLSEPHDDNDGQDDPDQN